MKKFSALVFIYLLFELWSTQGSGKLRVWVLDVGQGDSILIKTPTDENILVDGGEGNNVIIELGEVLAPWDRRIDLMILTHPHLDHVGGLIEVLERYEVKEVWLNPIGYSTPEFHEFVLKICSDISRIKIVFPTKGLCYGGKNFSLCTLYPVMKNQYSDIVDFKTKVFDEISVGGTKLRLSGKEVNNSSIVLLLSYGNFDVLLTGDAEVDVEFEFSIGLAQNVPIEVLKAGHHCSKTASSEKLLSAIDTKIAICSCGEGNKFGHPHIETLERFEKYEIEYFRTDVDGRIGIESDGNSWKIVEK